MSSPSMEEMEDSRRAWHGVPVTETLERLHTDRTKGLATGEARRRLDRYGPNKIEAGPPPRWYRVVARQFADALIGILVVAALISIAVGEVGDAITIGVILVLNGALGFVQEWRAEHALEALRRMLSPRCVVVRDGHPQHVDAASVVPGDLVQLATGAVVPADLRVVEARDLRLDQSSLTGESDSVAKDAEPVPPETGLAERQSMAWMGTAVTHGHALGVAVATGVSTEFGRIAQLTGRIEREQTPLQRQLARLGRQLGLFALALSAGVALVGAALGKSLLLMFMTGVSLAVAIVPEGLPAVVTITLALGVRTMVRRRALLRRLRAAETLGAATVICTDKTGTLTQNEMTLRRIWLASGEVEATGVGYDPAGHLEVRGRRIQTSEHPDLVALLDAGVRCNSAHLEREADGWQPLGEPTEVALIVGAYKAWLNDPRGSPIAVEFPFSSARKRMTIVEDGPAGRVAYLKGAPEVVLERCTRLLDGGRETNLTEADRSRAWAAYEAFARQGLRTLALARRRLQADANLTADAVERELTFLGIVGIIDPPRPEVPAAMEMARSAGIRVIMITGDAAETALAIARRLNLPASRVMIGPELGRLSDAQLCEVLKSDTVFARTTPEHKLRIVGQLQEMGHVAAMTGDGVNDAPALKKADIGIAMGIRGTDVARGASDIVLTDDNFASIIGAVEEGRRQYDNIQKFVRYLLSSNAGEVMAVFVNILMGGPLILLPVQILWMNMVTDGLTAVALGLEPAETDIMERPPRSRDDPLLDRGGVWLVVLLGAYIAGATLWLFHDSLGSGSLERAAAAQTVAFTGMVVLEKMNVLNFRALRAPLTEVRLGSNPYLFMALAATIGLQVAVVYVPFLQSALHTVPLGWGDWGRMVLIALPILLGMEAVKWARWRRLHSSPSHSG